MAYQQGGAKPPCCNTCRVSAGTIQFYWWPDLATATQSVTNPANGSNTPVTAIAPNGFTFTSPSVYMAFSSLFAKNWCSTVGDVWYNTTIGFHPDEIKTIQAYTTTYSSYYMTTYQGSAESVLVTDRGWRPPPARLHYSDLARNCSTISGYAYFPDDPQNDINGGWEHDACHPVLALPDSLINQQQAWVDNNCQAGDGYGAYDPPQALTAAENEAKPTYSAPAQPGSTSSPTSAPITSTYAAQSDTEPTSSANPGSTAKASETTWIVGGGSSSRPPVYASPVIASSANALDTASGTDFPTYLSPDMQHSASELDAPSRTSNYVAVTSDGAHEQSSSSRAYRPQMESSQTDLIVPGSIDRPLDGNTATYTIIKESGDGAEMPASETHIATYTVVHETTMDNGQVSFATYTTEFQPQPMQTVVEESTQLNGAVLTYTRVTPIGYDAVSDSPAENSAVPHTILQETTMANGETTVMSTIISLQPGGAPQPAATKAAVITIGDQTYTADASSIFVVNGQTVSANGATVTVDNTPIAILAGGGTAIVGGSTVSLAMITPAADVAPSVTLGHDVLRANTAGEYVVSPGTTLSVGGSSVIIDDTAYALKTNSAGQTILVAGAAAASTSSVNIGNYIMSAIGANKTSSNTEDSHSSTTASPSRTVNEDAATSATASTTTGDAVTVRSGSKLMLCLLTLLVVVL